VAQDPGACMIERPIVFVMGAGASSCYEFPLGKNLCRMVIEELKPNVVSHTQIIENTVFESGYVDRFQSALEFSGQNSVDAFLESRQEFLAIGKSAMATILIRYEKPSILWRFSDNNWMRYLYDKMRASTLEKFVENKISFITFNFDRSLEHFLFTSLQNTFGGSTEACADVMNKIPLLHLHGRLGFLPWQDANARPYGTELSIRALEMCVENIKLVHEELEADRTKVFEQAKTLMQHAEKIYFLGFGFGALNMERLGLIDLPANKAIATADGFTQTEVNNISNKLGGRISIYPNYNVDSLFRNMVSW
jgi:hypothetical protein